jgi:hypothetical protein
MPTDRKPSRTRRPARDLIDAVVENMRANLEELRYSTVAPSRYTVFVSPAEFERLQGLIPRLQAETVRALDEELEKLERRPRRAIDRLLGRNRPLENADSRWHVEFLPDLDDELADEQDIIVQSELVLPPVPELGTGERTRRVTTVHTGTEAAVRREISSSAAPSRATAAPVSPASPVAPVPASPAPPLTRSPQAGPVFARLVYEDGRGRHQHELVRESTTIGRGGLRFPVDVRVAASDEVSREHARIRYDAATGRCFLIDLSTHGTTLDGQAVPRGVEDDDGGKRENGTETPLPPRARIGLAGRVFLDFETLG